MGGLLDLVSLFGVVAFHVCVEFVSLSVCLCLVCVGFLVCSVLVVPFGCGLVGGRLCGLFFWGSVCVCVCVCVLGVHVVRAGVVGDGW